MFPAGTCCTGAAGGHIAEPGNGPGALCPVPKIRGNGKSVYLAMCLVTALLGTIPGGWLALLRA